MLLTSAITKHQQTEELLHERDSVLLWLLCAGGEDSEWRGKFSRGTFSVSSARNFQPYDHCSSLTTPIFDACDTPDVDFRQPGAFLRALGLALQTS